MKIKYNIKTCRMRKQSLEENNSIVAYTRKEERSKINRKLVKQKKNK